MLCKKKFLNMFDWKSTVNNLIILNTTEQLANEPGYMKTINKEATTMKIHMQCIVLRENAFINLLENNGGDNEKRKRKCVPIFITYTATVYRVKFVPKTLRKSLYVNTSQGEYFSPLKRFKCQEVKLHFHSNG